MCASPMPVLPAVPSTTVPRGFNAPFFSASRMMKSAARSFTEPPGFRNSALPRISQPVSRDSDASRISGVLPTAPVNPSRISMTRILYLFKSPSINRIDSRQVSRAQEQLQLPREPVSDLQRALRIGKSLLERELQVAIDALADAHDLRGGRRARAPRDRALRHDAEHAVGVGAPDLHLVDAELLREVLARRAAHHRLRGGDHHARIAHRRI